MNNFEFLTRYVLADYFAKSNLTRDGYTLKGFDVEERFDSRDGFNSSMIFGRIVYADKFGKQGRRESMTIKLIPKPSERSEYIDVTFSNEIFVYTRIIPFYGALNNSVLSIFPKFYYATSALGESDNANVVLVLENLSASGYRATNSRTFLDLEHLLLIVKKLAHFHACSYYAKCTQPRRFHSLVANLVETHFTATKSIAGYFNMLNDHFIRLLAKERRYSAQIERIRELLKDADQFMEQVFTKADEPVAVVCHGDFLRNNMLFRYDSDHLPVEVKFIDWACAKYCSPIVDLALILYMNADQETRNRHWDELLDAYCTTLRDTFPQIRVPSKNQIIDEFKVKALYAYLIIASFLPQMLLADETGSPSLETFFYPEYEEFVNWNWYDTPVSVSFNVYKKIFNSYREEKVLDVLKDIIDRGFV